MIQIAKEVDVSYNILTSAKTGYGLVANTQERYEDEEDYQYEDLSEMILQVFSDGWRSNGHRRQSPVPRSDLDGRSAWVFSAADTDGSKDLDRTEVINFFGGQSTTMLKKLKADTDGKVGRVQWDKFIKKMRKERGDSVLEGFLSFCEEKVENSSLTREFDFGRAEAKESNKKELSECNGSNGEAAAAVEEAAAGSNGEDGLGSKETALSWMDFNDEELRDYLKKLGDGVLQPNDYVKLMRLSGLSFSDEVILDSFIEADTDKDGVINYEELVQKFKKMQAEITNKQAESPVLVVATAEQSSHPSDFPPKELAAHLKNLFEIADENGDGVLQPAELAKLLSLSNFNIPASTILDVVEAADANKDGLISFEEFVPVVVEMMQGAEKKKMFVASLVEAAAVQASPEGGLRHCADRKLLDAEKTFHQLDTNGNGASALTYCT